MRYLFILLSCGILVSCSAQQKLVSKENKTLSINHCPDNGVCTFEVLQNKSMTLLNDGIGALYAEIYEGDNIIFKFEYKRNEIPNTADSNYSELIYAEIDPNVLNIELENLQLKEAKVLFARWCYCKGQTGYYKVSKGKLSITKENKSYSFNLEFKIDEVPQIITSINRLISIEK